MSNPKPRYISYNIISNAERNKMKKIFKENIRLGIKVKYDEELSSEKYVPSMYKNINEYEMDKFNASMFIDNEEDVPKGLENKLVAARIELEQLGLLEPYNEGDFE